MVFSIAGLDLAFGLAAWGLGLAALLRRWRSDPARWCSMGSLACCAVSLCTVVFELARYADIEDVSTFLDTANAFRLAAGVLLLGTLALNAAALIVCPRRQGAGAG